MKPIALITGATGKVGFATCKAINNRFSLYLEVRGGIRNPLKATKLSILEKIQQVKFDTTDQTSLREALRGVERMFLIPPNSENRVEVCKFLISQAQLAGVNFIVLQSMLIANNRKLMFGKQFGLIEDCLKESGIPYCILRTNLFMENCLAHRWHAVQNHEFITAHTEDVKVPKQTF